MPEQLSQSLQFETSDTSVKREEPYTTASSATDEQSISPNPTAPQQLSSADPNPAARPKLTGKQRPKAKTPTQKGAQGQGRGSVMTPTLLAGEEITYTPTTHRISKAKKGKKVHACEYPGCNKIFTRAEHRKRHEANHNTSPAYQCQMEGCRKPFQRADLLARHMERQHNMPSAEASAFRSQYRRTSATEVSSPARGGSISAPHLGGPASTTTPPLPQSSGTMSIGSIIEPNMHGEFKSEYSSHGGPSLHELPHAGSIGTTSRNLVAPELLYGLSSNSDSPFYSSSDSSYSPLSGVSDYLQPQQAIPRPYYQPQEVVQRSQSTSIECYQQPIVSQSPISGGPPTPAWTAYDPSLGYGHGLPNLTARPPYQYPSSSYAFPPPPYEINENPQPSMTWSRANDLTTY